MTTIQEVLWKLDWDYIGTPYYVSGHALYSALARQLSTELTRALHVSPGVFVPGEYGSYPDAHSQSGGVPYMGTGLRPVEAYADLFVFRDGAQRWLSETRPRDAHNTHTMRQFGDRTGYGATRTFGKPPEHRNAKRTMSWYIHAYCHTNGNGQLPLAEETLDDLRLGGARNYGFGQVTLEETRCIDIEALSYARLAAADAYQIELLSPYVLASDYPGAEDQSVPWWWVSDGDLRRRDTQFIKGKTAYDLQTVDYGQVVRYDGDSPITTAKAGVRGIGTHCKYGFGQYRVRPLSDDRVPERATAASQRGER